MIDKSNFTPEFLALFTNLELVMLQHELRQFPEDKNYLAMVLIELQRRERNRNEKETETPLKPD